MDVLFQDVRFALRMLRKARGASVVAILSLALGISVNTTVFSWVRGILLNPVPGVALRRSARHHRDGDAVGGDD